MMLTIPHRWRTLVVKRFTILGGELASCSRARSVLVVGGGYAVLAFVRQLRRYDRKTPITLIDKNPYHTMLVESHQVAAGSRSAESILLPFDQIDGVRFLRAEVLGGDFQARRLETTAGPVHYDRLVLALGSVDHDFGVPGVREHCQTLRGAGGRRGHPGPAGRPSAGRAPCHRRRRADRRGARRPPGPAAPGRSLTLVEAAPSLLPGLPARLARAAAGGSACSA